MDIKSIVTGDSQFIPRQSLKPAIGIHGVRPNVCATCCYGCIEDGGFFCLRVNGFSCDAGDMTQWSTTCDRYKADPNFTIIGNRKRKK